METEFFNMEILGNTIQDYSWFFGAVLLGFIFKRLISKYLSHLLFKVLGKKGGEVGVEKFNALLNKPIGFCVMLSVIYLGSTHIQYPDIWNLDSGNKIGLKMLVSKGFSLIYIYSIFKILIRLIDYVGLILLNGSALDGDEGTATDGGIDLGTLRNSNTNDVNMGRLNTAISASIEDGFPFRLNSQETLASDFYFVRAQNSEFNYSSNPSFVTGSTGALLWPTMQNNPQTFITSVGLYNTSNELCAIAKLSRPLIKDFTKELLVRVKLDY